MAIINRPLLLAALLSTSVAVLGAQSRVAQPAVRVELAISGRTFAVGQPIPYELKVTNLSKEKLPYTKWPQRLIPGHDIIVLDASGKAVPRPMESWQIDLKGSFASIDPGASITFKDCVNRWFVPDKPGVYSVRASWSPERSRMPAKQLPELYKSASVSIKIRPSTKLDRDNALSEAQRHLRTARTTDEKTDAMWLLAYTMDDRAIIDVLRAGKDIYLAQDVMNGLRRFPDKAVRGTVLRELRENGPYDSIARALSNLSVPADEAIPMLKHWLQKGDTEQRSGALLGLFMYRDRYKDPLLRELILAQLEDLDPTVRRHAVMALGDGEFGNTLDAVMEIAKNDPDKDVRWGAVTALGRYKDKNALPLLRKIAAGEDKVVAEAAKTAIKEIEKPAPSPGPER